MDLYQTTPISFIGDYDYNDDDRFISTHFNHLVIYDKIIRTKLFDLLFPDDAIMDIKYSLMGLCDNIGIDNNDIGKYQSVTIQLPIAIQQIGYIEFTRLDSGNITMGIKFDKTGFSIPFSLSIELTEQDVATLYEAFDALY